MKETTVASPRARKRSPHEKRDKQERKQRVLTHGTPSTTSAIADAVVIKDGPLFLLVNPDGNVPVNDGHGLGLYYRDCRYLSGYELFIADTYAQPLVGTASPGFKAVFELTNPDFKTRDGRVVQKESIGIKWERMVDSERFALRDVITLESYAMEAVEFPLTLHFSADFLDMFAVRSLLNERPGKLNDPRWDEFILFFSYDGADGIFRGINIRFSPDPDRKMESKAQYDISLQPGETKEILISLIVVESKDREEIQPRPEEQTDLKRLESLLHRSAGDWLKRQTFVDSDSLSLNRLIQRSFRDLRMLRNTLEGREYFDAGVPWFVTLFGRDSLICSIETLAYDPRIAENVLFLLASLQGTQVDEWRDEQPGKIIHELRVGELANLGEVPHAHYYGTVDATPLFLILIGMYVRWTGNLDVFNKLRGNVERALEWIDKYGDLTGGGFVQYQSRSEHGLVNQGWKDSGDAIVDENGDLAKPPIAVVEVQGYVYRAKHLMAELYRRSGDAETAARLEREAEQLRQRFNEAFWLDGSGFYALALEKGNRPLPVFASNAGQALWSGIADQDKAGKTAERLMQPDMYSGWGVRTLSDKAKRFNPVGYHLGTVWPHDNAIIAAGLRRYGFDKEARQVMKGIYEAATHFPNDRLPELFSGFSRDDYDVPVAYPVACHPQAWAAGSIPYMVETALGLVPDAFNKRLRIVRPTLPDFVHHLELHGLRIGEARADLSFDRIAETRIAVEILNVEGKLDILVQPAPADKPPRRAGTSRQEGRSGGRQRSA
jgi:glycogen debranching enzyme